MDQIRTRLRQLLLDTCLYYERNIDDQVGISKQDLLSRMNQELNKRVDEIMVITSGRSTALSE
ncbi:hypothetical protein AUK40_01050 [Candidatus Wirthbacteria bacterium CG2_30_54_11]|uniref:Uncharacterized protein n=1 Tax=Candidatus Wirthbacteria bacterium CG2_30_54_11 TaxID=1817892 RepID=A0A1J5IPC4_9BACT|nr:MAG: hypothetical protein AUK40_01050 [Candidatus Wirthbacteria bacterium CG2_30_54_11]